MVNFVITLVVLAITYLWLHLGDYTKTRQADYLFVSVLQCHLQSVRKRPFDADNIDLNPKL